MIDPDPSKLIAGAREDPSILELTMVTREVGPEGSPEPSIGAAVPEPAIVGDPGAAGPSVPEPSVPEPATAGESGAAGTPGSRNCSSCNSGSINFPLHIRTNLDFTSHSASHFINHSNHTGHISLTNITVSLSISIGDSFASSGGDFHVTRNGDGHMIDFCDDIGGVGRANGAFGGGSYVDDGGGGGELAVGVGGSYHCAIRTI